MGKVYINENYLTYHHIKPESRNGLITLENGVLLTRNAHRDLNKLEEIDYLLFVGWNELSIRNKGKGPLDIYLLEQSKILKDCTKKLLYKNNTRNH